ncbi:hypothetical protein MVEG_08712 [Podila verticillata NRRL 6337]|nr:hypothetical protein MVEG_08712 [Podila verticillata NRRL 6337]
MRKNSCLFDRCKKGLLDKDQSHLTQNEKQHIRRYHRHTIHSIGLHRAVFIFRRDPSRHNQYVCVCDSLLSSTGSLTTHVLGLRRPSNTRGPCPLIFAKAVEITLTKEVVDDEEKPINYQPVNRELDAPECNEQQRIIIHEDLSSNENKVVNLNNADEENKVKSILKANGRVLKKDIRALKKARADIKRLAH